MILSLLIPTTPDRVEMFTTLFNELHRQLEYMQTFHPSLGQVEILVDDAPRFLDGGPSIGKKRDNLVKKARGKYLCFVDSDDYVSPDYLETLVRMCCEDKDICVFRNLTRTDNYWAVVDMSLHYENEQARPGLFTRQPWHICPVRSVYGKMCAFPDLNYGEDWMWMHQVLEMCKTQATSPAILHEYRHSSKVSEADKIMNHQ